MGGKVSGVSGQECGQSRKSKTAMVGRQWDPSVTMDPMRGMHGTYAQVASEEAATAAEKRLCSQHVQSSPLQSINDNVPNPTPIMWGQRDGMSDGEGKQ